MTTIKKFMNRETEIFVSSINFDELRKIATLLNHGKGCEVGGCIIGGFAILYELIFHANGGPADAEREVWLARFPLPHLVTPQSALDEVLLSSVAALRYIEKHVPSNTTGNGLKNLVPVVYGVALKDDPQNKVGASFALMRKMKGRTMRDVYSKRRKDLEWVSERVQALACKFYRQLAGVVMELASTRFPYIGSLHHDRRTDTFSVEAYLNTYTCSPPLRGRAYMSLPTRYKGPYISMSSWYHSMSKLNYQHSILAYKEEVAARDERIGVKSRQRMANFLILNEIGESIVMKENVSLFDKGPFVLNHDDLSWENILVDDDFNITAIIDFPGTIVPLPSLLVYPYLFHQSEVERHDQKQQDFDPFHSKDLFLQAINSHLTRYENSIGSASEYFISSQSEATRMESKPIPEPPFDPNHLGPRLPALTSIRILYEPEDNFPRLSPLVPHTAPRIIMPDTRQLFEVSLTGPLDSNILPRLFQDVFGKPFEKSLEYSRLWKEVEEKLF